MKWKVSRDTDFNEDFDNFKNTLKLKYQEQRCIYYEGQFLLSYINDRNMKKWEHF